MALKYENKVTIHKGSTTGMVRLGWEALETQLKETGQLMKEQNLRSVYIAADGLYFSTYTGKGQMNDRSK